MLMTPGTNIKHAPIPMCKHIRTRVIRYSTLSNDKEHTKFPLAYEAFATPRYKVPGTRNQCLNAVNP